MFTHHAHAHRSPPSGAATVPKTPHQPHDSHSFARAHFGVEMDAKPLGAGGFGQVYGATIVSGGEWRGSHTPRHRGERIAVKSASASASSACRPATSAAR